MEQDNLNYVMQEEELKEVAGGGERIPGIPMTGAHYRCSICGWSLKTNLISREAVKEAVKTRHDSETTMPGCKGNILVVEHIYGNF